MEEDQRQKYIRALAQAVELVDGPRDEDYNRGGIKLRDYWRVNGIRSPLQMVDMKLKRALSQVSGWDVESKGTEKPIPTGKKQVDKFVESMLDLINYAAFTICEAESLLEEHECSRTASPTPSELAERMEEVINLWKRGQQKTRL